MKHFTIIMMGIILILNTNSWGTNRLLVSSTTQPESPDEAAFNLLNCIKNNKYEDAVKLFHFPPSYNALELKNDIANVTFSLEHLLKEFGDIKSITPLNNPLDYYQVGVSGGDIPYWENNPKSIQLEYKVNFKKEGLGIIAIHTCNINQGWQIRSIHFGLPVDKVGAKERMMEIINKLISLRKSRPSEI